MKIRRWFRKFFYPDTPNAATMEEWADIEIKERKRPVIYFLVRTVPRWYRIKMRHLNDIKYWFLYRLVNKHKYHRVETGLKPNYYEVETRMLHANFNMLKEYVEGEVSFMQLWRKDEGDTDWISDARKAGLEHLDWEISLVHEANEVLNPKIVGKPTLQAIAAKEKKALYLWWVDERPARPDPWDVYITDDDDDDDVDGNFFVRMAKRTPAQKAASTKQFRQKEKLEEKYDAEDTKMLIRLMKLRKSLWT